MVLPGYPHHVTQRGVRSMDIFFTREDRLLYLDTLKEHAAAQGLDILAWCLMTNHIHLVVVPTCEETMAHAIGETHRLYTRAINFREGVRGHLFQERFFSCPLDETHFIAAVRYVQRNPVRASLVEALCRYQ